MTPTFITTDHEAAILSRVIKPEERTLSQSAARAILQFDFDDDDRQRMHELAVKNQDGALTTEERAELNGYVHVGLILDLMRSKARLSLQRSPSHR